MTTELLIFKSLDFDGAVFVRYSGAERVQSIRYQLLKDGVVVAERDAIRPGETAQFDKQPPGAYQAKAHIKLADGSTSIVDSAPLLVPATSPQPASAQAAPAKSLKGGHCFYDNVENYYLEIKLQPGGLDKLQNEVGSSSLSTFLKLKPALSFSLVYSPEVIAKHGGTHFAHFYRIHGAIARDELIPLAQELETLDYVIYCSVTPDTTGMKPPEEPPRAGTGAAEPSPPFALGDVTPDFTSRQKYLGDWATTKTIALNVRAAWTAGATGRGATVRHLDYGVYRNHEDLGNITVVNSRPETNDCNHGTASTGCIAATNNGFGVTGIAYDCQFYFYDTGDLDKIVRDAQPGDIVGLDIQFSLNGVHVPVIHSKAWWNKIFALSNLRATVVVAAGNGGQNLSPEYGLINDYGDSGSMLAGACISTTGRRASFSNYGHYTSLVNAWGDWSVATTGYGGLQRVSNDRNYTSTFSGTSSATPLSVGALAVLQGYSITKYQNLLGPYWMRDILGYTGGTHGEQDLIGRQPNVYSAVLWIDKHST
ncbi:S8 family serine peptidase [Trinickia terrae]|nr:S8 family serine peptidase [Trinickia terrae]